MKNQYTGILLCGGKSSRMGRDKYALPYNNQPMYMPALNILNSCCSETLISSNVFYPEFENYKIITDEIPNIGPMGGIYTCIKVSKNPYNLVLACDMPLVTGRLMSKLLEIENDFDAYIPVLNEQIEPLYAIYNKSILPILENKIKSNEYSLFKMLKQLNVCYVQVSMDEYELKNINFPTELV